MWLTPRAAIQCLPSGNMFRATGLTTRTPRSRLPKTQSTQTPVSPRATLRQPPGRRTSSRTSRNHWGGQCWNTSVVTAEKLATATCTDCVDAGARCEVEAPLALVSMRGDGRPVTVIGDVATAGDADRCR